MRSRSARTVLFLLPLLGAVVVPASPASAAVSGSVIVQMPSTVTVGETGTGYLTYINTNSGAEATHSNSLGNMLVDPTCGDATPSCPTPDSFVLALSAGVGVTETACAGVSFTFTQVDPSGKLSIVPSQGFVLGPPGGAQGQDRCSIQFTFDVRRRPTIDGDAAPGVQTFMQASGSFVSITNSQQSSGFGVDEISVNRALPGFSTQASPTVRAPGFIFDVATVEGVPGVATPTGTVSFSLYSSVDPNCTGAAFGSQGPVQQEQAGRGRASSSAQRMIYPGTYRFVASYSGDANFLPASGVCGELGEQVTVLRRTLGDYDNDADAERALRRPASSEWFVRGGSPEGVVYGTSTDIPVPADYDGDGDTDIALFRPSNGFWYIRGTTPEGVQFGGAAGDVPVPGDYNGDGRAERAIWRPSTRQWFVQGVYPSGVTYGLGSDIPVPGDYDSDGDTDIALYRPSTGDWFVRGGTPEVTRYGGLNGDVPVPGDYDGNGFTDRAIRRPSTREWFVQGASPEGVVYGLATDVAVPADYDGNGTTEIALFRRSNGTWYVRGAVPEGVTYGQNADIPLSLPYAIRKAYYP